MVRIEVIESGGGRPTTPVSPTSPLFEQQPEPPYYPPYYCYHHPPYPCSYSYGFEYGFGYGYSPYPYPPQPQSQVLPPAPAEFYNLNHQPQPPMRVGLSRYPGPATPTLQKGSTTLMIRNLPTKLRRHELVNLLDEHCKEQNKTAPRLTMTRHSAYDFLYLPFDFIRGGNLGYAFVNFTTPGAAFRFFKSWNGKSWINFYKCSKICAITRANIQGKEASKRHLEKCKFFCDTDEFLPVEFSPPRNGYNTAVIKMKMFGIWVAKDEDKYCKRIWRKKE